MNDWRDDAAESSDVFDALDDYKSFSTKDGLCVSSIQEIVDAMDKGTEYDVWTPSGWARARPVKTPMTDVYKITLSGGDTVCMGENHLQPTREGTFPAKDLKVGMWLPYNKTRFFQVHSGLYTAPAYPPGYEEDDSFYYFRIESIENSGPQKDENLYCFEVDSADHLFTLASGLVTHNCRLQLDKRELRKRGGGLFGSDELTGSIGVVTINMPRIGYLATDEADFFARLSRLMELARDSLLIKRKVVSHLLETGLFPYTKRYLGNFNNHFNTIGLCGMNECLLNFLGPDTTIATKRGQAFALKTLNFMREKLADFQEATGDLFNLEASPAESTSYRLAKHDKERFPDIIAAGTDEPYYTNSTQLPVMETEDVFDALDLQEALQRAYTGGTVFHVFLGEAISDWRACRDLVKAIASNYRIPYFTISPTFSVCPVHGYLAGEHFECPKCKEEKQKEILARISSLEKEKEAALHTAA
jgi:hypothetical protein